MSLRSPVALLLAATLALVTLAGCGGGPQLISQDEEVRLGHRAAADFEKQYGGRDGDPRRGNLVQTVGRRLAAVATSGDYPDYPYEFHVLANDQVNANAFPGGVIYVWRGLFPVIGYEEQQLAWVIGHEVSHVARQHSVRRIERALGYELVIQLLLGKDTGGRIGQAVANLSLQEYGRDQELEADRLGVTFARRAGYDPTAALPVLEAFKKQQADPNNLELLFASHPGNTTREDALKAYFRQQGWSGRWWKP